MYCHNITVNCQELETITREYTIVCVSVYVPYLFCVIWLRCVLYSHRCYSYFSSKSKWNKNPFMVSVFVIFEPKPINKPQRGDYVCIYLYMHGVHTHTCTHSYRLWQICKFHLTSYYLNGIQSRHTLTHSLAVNQSEWSHLGMCEWEYAHVNCYCFIVWTDTGNRGLSLYAYKHMSTHTTEYSTIIYYAESVCGASFFLQQNSNNHRAANSSS